MKTSKRFKVMGLLGMALIAPAALVLALGWGASSSEPVSASDPAVNFSIGVDAFPKAGATATPTADNNAGNDICNTNTLDTKCDLSSGQTFTVNLYLKAIDKGLGDECTPGDTTNPPDPACKPGGPNGTDDYRGFDVDIDVSGVAFSGAPNCGAWQTKTGGIGAGNAVFAGSAALWSCNVGSGVAESEYTGKIGSQAMTCTAGGTVTLVHGNGNTDLFDSSGVFNESGSEVLTINCPTPTSTPIPSDTPTATNTPTNTPTPTPPPVPRWVKADAWTLDKIKDYANSSSTNLFLTRQGTKIPPLRCEDSTDAAAFVELLTLPIVSPDPKGDLLYQKLGAFEFEVRFDPKLVCVNLVDLATLGSGGSTRFPELPAVNGWMCIVDDKDEGQLLEGIARMGCVSKGKDVVPVENFQNLGPVLAGIVIQPQPELYSQIRPNQDNGIAVQLLDQDCKLSDDQGHPIAIFSCEDADVTIRYLEGDVEPDCQVDALDQQNIAFRWGVGIGNIRLYNSRFDLEPSGAVKGDGDIDIRDLQFVFGRHGSKCTQWNNRGYKGPIWPDQPPVNPKD